MHLRLDDLRKQARMLQMYESERTRTRSTEGTPGSQASDKISLDAEGGLSADVESRMTGLRDPIQLAD